MPDDALIINLRTMARAIRVAQRITADPDHALVDIDDVLDMANSIAMFQTRAKDFAQGIVDGICHVPGMAEVPRLLAMHRDASPGEYHALVDFLAALGVPEVLDEVIAAAGPPVPDATVEIPAPPVAWIWRAWDADRTRICDCGLAHAATREEATMIARMTLGGPYMGLVVHIDVARPTVAVTTENA